MLLQPVVKSIRQNSAGQTRADQGGPEQARSRPPRPHAERRISSIIIIIIICFIIITVVIVVVLLMIRVIFYLRIYSPTGQRSMVVQTQFVLCLATQDTHTCTHIHLLFCWPNKHTSNRTNKHSEQTKWQSNKNKQINTQNDKQLLNF